MGDYLQGNKVAAPISWILWDLLTHWNMKFDTAGGSWSNLNTKYYLDLNLHLNQGLGIWEMYSNGITYYQEVNNYY